MRSVDDVDLFFTPNGINLFIVLLFIMFANYENDNDNDNILFLFNALPLGHNIYPS